MAPPLSAFLLASFVAFFVTVNPIKSAAVFAALTERSGPAHRRSLAIKSVAVAAGILVVFTLFGDDLLRFIGISLPGTGEAPNCPVFIDGEHFTTLRGTYDELADGFRSLVDNYVATHYPTRTAKNL